MPASRASPAVPFLLFPLLAALTSPAPAEAQSLLERAGDFLRSVVDLFVPDDEELEDLDRALEEYAKGHDFTTMRHALRLRDEGPDWVTDEANLLLGLAAASRRLRIPALVGLRGVLDAEDASPYYPLALATLLALERDVGHHVEAADAAERHFVRIWLRPPTPHAAAIKARFLETGVLHLGPAHDHDDAIAVDREQRRRKDRPNERAAYLAGQALLREGRHEQAAICFEALGERSLYYAYAQYGLAQARYALGLPAEAERILGRIQTHPGLESGELFLRDRAALLSGQILHEIEEDSTAIDRLQLVSRDGPYALHAALLSAEIQAGRDEPALALVYLNEVPADGHEPKLLARAAALEARLRRRLGDDQAAVSRLEHGVEILTRYESALEEARERRGLDDLISSLRARTHAREALSRWRRENVRNAIPDLLRDAPRAGVGARLLASVIGGGDNGFPVVFQRRELDPWVALSRPRIETAEPPSGRVFPALFRRMRDDRTIEAIRHPERLREALRDGAAIDVAFVALDGLLELRSASAATADGEVRRFVSDLGFPDRIGAMVVQNRERDRILETALVANDDPEPTDLVAIAEEQLEDWRHYQRELLRRAVRTEEESVRDLRVLLQLELSESLAARGQARDLLN